MHGEQYLAPKRRGGADDLLRRRPPASASLIRSVAARAAARRRGRARHRHARGLRTAGRRLPLLRDQPAGDRRRAQRSSPISATARRQIETVLGDARLAMEREPPQQLRRASRSTRSRAIRFRCTSSRARRWRCICKHLKPDGVIAFHVTNRFLRLAPVVKRIADDQRPADGARRRRSRRKRPRQDRLGAREPATRRFWRAPKSRRAPRRHRRHPGLRVWTDDFNNLFQILK